MAWLRWGWKLGISLSDAAQDKGNAIAHVTTWRSRGKIQHWNREEGGYLESKVDGYSTPCGRVLGLSPSSPKAKRVDVCKHCATAIGKPRFRHEVGSVPLHAYLGAYWFAYDVDVPEQMRILPNLKKPFRSSTARSRIINETRMGR